jgi:hypothetical protein
MSLISFKPISIKRFPDFHAKFVVKDSPNCLEVLKYDIVSKVDVYDAIKIIEKVWQINVSSDTIIYRWQHVVKGIHNVTYTRQYPSLPRK